MCVFESPFLLSPNGRMEWARGAKFEAQCLATSPPVPSVTSSTEASITTNKERHPLALESEIKCYFRFPGRRVSGLFPVVGEQHPRIPAMRRGPLLEGSGPGSERRVGVSGPRRRANVKKGSQGLRQARTGVAGQRD